MYISIKKISIFALILIFKISAIAQVVCNADAPITQNLKMCGYEKVPVFTITRGAKSIAAHSYEYRIFNSNDSLTNYNQPLTTISSSSSVFNPSSYITVTKSDTNRFWVAEYDLTDGCLGRVSEMYVNVLNVKVPVVSSPNICIGRQGKTNLVIPKGNFIDSADIYWFDSTATLVPEPLGSYLSKSNPYIVKRTDTLPLGSYKYLVSQVVNGCQSSKVPVKITVMQIPVPPSTESATGCGVNFGSMTAIPTMPGNTIKWYNVSGSQSIGAGYSFIPPKTLTIGTTYFRATQIAANGCESDASYTTFTVINKPIKPTLVKDTLSICDYSFQVPEFQVKGAIGTILWIDSNKIFDGLKYTTTKPKDSTLIKITKVIQLVKGCASDTVNATLQIVPRPVPPKVNNIKYAYDWQLDYIIGSIPTSTNKNNWFNDSLLLLKTNSSIFVNGNYLKLKTLPKIAKLCSTDSLFFYSTQSTIGTNCESNYSRTKIIITNKPQTPSFSSVRDFAYCSNFLKVDTFILKPQANVVFEWHNAKTGLPLTSVDGTLTGLRFVPDTNNFKPNARLYYSIKAIDSTGCSSDSIVARCFVSPDMNLVPKVVTKLSPLCFKQGVSKTIETSEPGNIITWFMNGDTLKGETKNKIIFSPKSIGVYNFKLTQKINYTFTSVKNICYGPSIEFSQLVTDSCANISSFSNVMNSVKLSVFPNPVSSILHIRTQTDNSETGYLKIFNINGTLQYYKTVPNVSSIDESISIASFPVGIYTIVVETSRGAISELLSIER